jgi:hypothetical protein
LKPTDLEPKQQRADLPPPFAATTIISRFVLFGKKKSLHSEKNSGAGIFFCVHLNFQEGVRFFDPFFDCIYDGEPFWATTKFRYGRKMK